MITTKPIKALNPAYRKVKPGREAINTFKQNLGSLLKQLSADESEEFNKNLLSRFLRDTYYHPEYFINTKGRNDLVIHNGKDAKANVGVIIEAKRPGNRAEMISTNNFNTKALHELLWYFFGERITGKNDELKHLVVTNVEEWFVFDAQLFDKLFAQDKALVRRFEAFRDKQLSSTSTDYFYREIAAPAIESSLDKLTCTHFRIKDYAKALLQEEADKKLIPLFKILSPEHMLKLPFVNDSNTLDKRFYAELLHIIGLTESRKGGKKLIERKKQGERDSGSLLENTIDQLDSLDKVNRMEDTSEFGSTKQERLFNVGLELCITWINRILFLKLLEAQVIRYHKNDNAFSFLNIRQLPRFGDMNALFFSVLARKPEDRNEYVKETFAHVPYLNSSLFEVSEIEDKTIVISNLLNERTIPVHPKTVLKNKAGKRISGTMNTLEYLFAFLNTYDFASEGSEEIQEENKTLINASVLGLIFEKINGYKDGSFFTPGFITMYMCRETIRRAVVQKYNEAKGWQCKTFTELNNKIEIHDADEANKIINSLKICDPAVGSGHFLVSALNEIIAIKHELRILKDSQGRRLKEYNVEVVNDELVITDKEGELFEYRPGNSESQRVQETLFHEKQTIIEGCLFGVDINPNSVKICRLRLWIELLKHAYYKEDGQLETLPNIDINIKCGNSLVSRFPLDADLRQALKRSKWSIEDYQVAVKSYRRARTGQEKSAMKRLIDDIKSSFRSQIYLNDPIKKRLDRLSNELYHRFTGHFLFEPEAGYGKQDEDPKEKQQKEQKKLEQEIERLQEQLNEKRVNEIFYNAVEWRFEFPEVLNDEGMFLGFDVVVGNPPYIRQETLGEIKKHLQKHYKVFASGGDIFSYFYELGHGILREGGYFSFINNTFDKTTAGKALREFVNNNFRFERYVDFTEVIVFEEATTYPIILIAQKTKKQSNFKYFKYTKDNFGDKGLLNTESAFTVVEQNRLNSSAWTFGNVFEQKILAKIQSHKTILARYGKCYYGIKTALNEAFVTEKRFGEHAVLKDVFDGKDLKKWKTPPPFKKMIVFESGSTAKKFGKLSEGEALEKMREVYPDIFKHLEPFKEKAAKRHDKGEYWWELRNCAYYDLFEKPKIIFPNLQNKNKFAYDDKGVYLNAPAVFLPSNDKAVLAVLNSKLVWHFLKSICVVRSGGYIEVKPQYFEQIPVPTIEGSIKLKLIELAETAIREKCNNQQADISRIENQIDQLVYQLYGLTEEEIDVVEN